ncbi:MAG: hypothetical protein PVI30_05955 [Myxococcales bacterium]|jgi:hypothetical protein
MDERDARDEQRWRWEGPFRRPLSELVDALSTIEPVVGSPAEGVEFRIERMQLGLPVELAVQVGPEGEVSFRTSPPSQQIETTVFPVLHQLRLSLTVDEEGLEDAGEEGGHGEG